MSSLIAYYRRMMLSVAGASAAGYSYYRWNIYPFSVTSQQPTEAAMDEKTKSKPNESRNKRWTVLSARCPHPLCRQKGCVLLMQRHNGFYCWNCTNRWDTSGNQTTSYQGLKNQPMLQVPYRETENEIVFPIGSNFREILYDPYIGKAMYYKAM